MVEFDARMGGIQLSENALTVELMDGRSVSAPLARFPRLLAGTPEQRRNWRIAGAGYGLHWPDLDEDLSVAGLLRTHSAA